MANAAASQGYIIIEDGADTLVYHSADLANDGATTLLVTLVGVSAATVVSGNFDVVS